MSTTAPVALGGMPNAPLVFVLAQVRFTPSSQTNLDTMRNVLRELLPSEFQTIDAVMAYNIAFINTPLTAKTGAPAGGAQIVVGYDFQSADQKAVVRIAQDALTFAVSRYKDYADFSVLWSQILAALPEIGVTEVVRIGLRYVDFIYPSEGKIPEDYFNPPFDFRQTGEVEGALGIAQTNIQVQEYAFADGRLRVQYARGIGQPCLPLELEGLLEVTPVGARSAYSGPTATFDTDRWIDGRRPSEALTLSKEFFSLHSDLSNVFSKVTTSMAKAEWSKN